MTRIGPLFLVGCSTGVVGAWEGTAVVEILGAPLSHDLYIDVQPGEDVTGAAVAEGWGQVTRGDQVLDVEVEGVCCGAKVDLRLVPEKNEYVFGLTEYGHEYGGGEVRPSVTFALDGRTRGRTLKARFDVVEYGDIWEEVVFLDRAE